jgi:hypothetical protein
MAESLDHAPMSIDTQVCSILLPDVWRTIAGFLPVGGPDGQWRVKRVCKGLMPADMDKARLEWNEKYELFVNDLRITEGNDIPDVEYLPETEFSSVQCWTAQQTMLLLLLSVKVAKLFRPPADLARCKSELVSIRLQESGGVGTSIALHYFKRVLDVHCRSDLCTRLVLPGFTIAPESTPAVVICDGGWSCLAEHSLPATGGVFIAVADDLSFAAMHQHISVAVVFSDTCVSGYTVVARDITHSDASKPGVVLHEVPRTRTRNISFYNL